MSGQPELIRKPIEPSNVQPDLIQLRETICGVVRQECTRCFGTLLKTIISTGSLARDEASILRKEESWAVRGDAEFMLVFEQKAPLPAADILDAVHRRIESELIQQRIECKIDLSAVHPTYFLRLPAHIFTYELKHCGRVIAGDPAILHSIPDYSVDELSKEDAWRLLCHRLIELLECSEELSGERGRHSSALQYKILKLYLDMATSLLVFVGAYAPSYRERRDAMSRLASRSVSKDAFPFDLSGFADLVAACTAEKLLPCRDEQGPVDLSQRTALQTAHLLWCWELQRLTGADAILSDIQLMDKLIRLQTFTAKVRGWLYVLRARGWYRSYRHWPRWLRLACRTSPRYCIYVAACCLLFHTNLYSRHLRAGRNQNRGWDNPSAWLPVIDQIEIDGDDQELLKIASAVVSNYREFVVGTRA
jgi:hypothetical protein